MPEARSRDAAAIVGALADDHRRSASAALSLVEEGFADRADGRHRRSGGSIP